MKQSKKCPKCHSLRVGYIENVPDITSAVAVPDGSAQRGTSPPPRAAGVGPVVDTGMLRWGKVSALVGALEAYVCVDCGLYETYVRTPDTVDWEDIRDFHWMNDHVSSGPYR